MAAAVTPTEMARVLLALEKLLVGGGLMRVCCLHMLIIQTALGAYHTK